MLTLVLGGLVCLTLAAVGVRSQVVSRGLLVLFFVLSFSAGLIVRSFGEPVGDVARLVQTGAFLTLAISALLDRRSRRSPHWRPVLVVVVGIAVTGVVAMSPDLAATINGFRLTGLYLLAPIVGWRFRHDQRWLLRAVVVTSAPSVLLGLRQAVLGLTVAEQAQVTTAGATFQVEDQVRLIGASATGQELSYLLVLLTAVACAGSLRPTAGRRWPWTGYLGVVLLLQLVALQRSALVASMLVVVASFWWFLRGRRWTVLAGAVLAAPALVLVALTGLSLTGDRTETALSRALSVFSLGSDASIGMRTADVWPAAVEAIRARPFTGWGPGSAGAPTVADPSGAPLGEMITDNLFLHVGVQYGLLVAVAVLVVLALLARDGVRAPASAVAARAGGVGVVGLLVAGTVGSYLSIFDVSGPLLILAGTAIARPRPSGPAATVPQNHNREVTGAHRARGLPARF